MSLYNNMWSTELLDLYNEIGEINFKRDVNINHLLNGGGKFVNPYLHSELRSPYLDFNYTKEEMSNILSPNKLLNHLFTLDKVQIEMNDLIVENKFNVFHTARQIGTSTAIVIYVLKRILNFKLNKKEFVDNLCIFSESNTHFDNFLNLYSKLPFYLKPGVVEYNNNYIKFENGSSIRFLNKISMLHSSNFDFIWLPDFAFNSESCNNSIYNSIFPMILSIRDSRMVISSAMNCYPASPTFVRVIKSNNDVINVSTYDWKSCDRGTYYTEDNMDYIINSIGVDGFLTEYECLIPGTSEFKSRMRELKIRKIIG